MRKPPPSVPIVAVGCLLLCAAGAAQALGFGRVINVSHLGQPLNFAATLRLDADESLVRECVSAEVLAGEARIPSAAVRVTLEPGSDSSERTLRVTTVSQIEEPVVTVTVSAGCNGRLTRSFVTLVDPPGMNLAQAGSAAPVTLPPQRVESQVAPVVTVVEAAAAASAPRAASPAASAVPRAPAPRTTRPRIAIAPADPASAPPRVATAEPRKRSAPSGAAVSRRAGPRLQLDPAAPPATAQAARPGEAAALVATAASAAALASGDAATAVAAAASAARAAEAAQRRLAAIEENMARLREESQATQKALATLQASLEQAQSSRYTNPLVYVLAALSTLLALAVAVLWWRQSRTRPTSQWWLAPAGAPPVPPMPRRGEMPSGAARLETQPAVMDERAVVRALDEPAPPPRPAPPPPAVSTAAPVLLADPPILRRELSVEELIDLEQQADFFVVLGQDEAAIDLLMGHVRSSGGASPLPYLKLLEIYRRRGEREAYERIRERFNRRFNAYAPDWDSDLMQGKSLEDYPPVMAQLQRLWGEPSRVTLSLDAALLREDGSADTFDLPAYRELLFLYSIARDLAEHPTSAGAVDLLLPMDGEEPERPIEKLTASRLMGFAATDQLSPSVDLDVTTALPGHAPRANDFIGLINVQLPPEGDDKR